MASNFHWSEDEIFALRYVRACAYLEEIALDQEQEVPRLIPRLPEVEKFEKLLMEE